MMTDKKEQEMNIELNFDESDEVKGTLESILDILDRKSVDPDNLLDVTLPASLWFDGMQAIAMAGSVLNQMVEVMPEEIEEREQFKVAVSRISTIYNEVYDSLVRLANQKPVK